MERRARLYGFGPRGPTHGWDMLGMDGLSSR